MGYPQPNSSSSCSSISIATVEVTILTFHQAVALQGEELTQCTPKVQVTLTPLLSLLILSSSTGTTASFDAPVAGKKSKWRISWRDTNERW
jgi:hypothetical protein